MDYQIKKNFCLVKTKKKYIKTNYTKTNSFIKYKTETVYS